MAATADNWTSISALAGMATGAVNPMFWGIMNVLQGTLCTRVQDLKRH